MVTECAADQGAFWSFHDRYAAADARLYEWENVLGFADALGLDLDELTLCMVERRHLPTVQEMHDGGWQLGVRGTPTVFVNDEWIESPTPANIIAAAQAALPE